MACRRVGQRAPDVLVSVLRDDVEGTGEMALAVARRRPGVDHRDASRGRHGARRASWPCSRRRTDGASITVRGAASPAADLEALPGAQAPGARDLGVGAGAALPAEGPEVDCGVRSTSVRRMAGSAGSPSCARVGTTQRGVGRPTVSSSPDGACRRPPSERVLGERARRRGRRRARGWGESAGRPSPKRGPRARRCASVPVVMRWIGARSWYAPVAPKRPSAGVSARSRRTRRSSSSESAASISAPTSALPSGSVMRSGGCPSQSSRSSARHARRRGSVGPRLFAIRSPVAGVDDDPPPVAFAAAAVRWPRRPGSSPSIALTG